MSRNIYVGLFFFESSYVRGIVSTIDYFNMETPGNTVIIEKYIIDGTPTLTLSCLNDFLLKYPTGDRATISERTSVITVLSTELQTLGLDIPCFSITATSNIIKTLSNSLTYAPFDQYSVMNNFLIYKEYQMKYFKVLYLPNTLDDLFFQSYIQTIQTQGSLLGITIEIDTIILNKIYNFEENTSIVLLCDDYSFVTSSFLSQIPKGCYISMTDINYNVNDIFGDIPAFVILPFPIDYTITSKNVYNSLTNKTNFIYNIYGFFDILYTINYFTTSIDNFNLNNYVNSNPFTLIPSAFGYSSWNLNINGSDYGLYDIIFTKNSVINNEETLFNLYNNGGIGQLPQSKSIFMSMGIAPFFSSKIFICRQNYIKIYNENKELIIVRFEKNTTMYNNSQIIVAETLPCNFNVSYNEDGYFTFLQPIFSICKNQLIVNNTMSKEINYEIMFENGIYNQNIIDELKVSLCNSQPPIPPIPPIPPNPIPPISQIRRGHYQNNPNAANARICKSICGTVDNCKEYQYYIYGINK